MLVFWGMDHIGKFLNKIYKYRTEIWQEELEEKPMN